MTFSSVVDEWAEQYDRTWQPMPFIDHVQIFENRGEMMGASNPHPHCQIWASESVPNEPAKEIRVAAGISTENRKLACLCDYLESGKAKR